MNLTENQKTLLFYALSAMQDTLYFDDDLQQIDYNYSNYRLSLFDIRNITQDINKLNELIDKTLSDLC